MPFVSSVRGSYGPQSERQWAGGITTTPTGGTITTAGGYRIHTFLVGQSGTSFVLPKIEGLSNVNGTTNVEYLVVGGGGGGARTHGGGGGGAGGYRTGSISTAVNSYIVSVGSNPGYASPGTDSSFSTITSIGGGRGGTAHPSGAISAQVGGSGGGFGWHAGGGGGGAGAVGNNTGGPLNQASYGEGTAGQGNRGGSGTDAPANNGAAGGAGLSSSITGSAITRAGGGGGNKHLHGNCVVGW